MENRKEASSNLSTEKNKGFDRRLIEEVFSKGNVAIIDELVGDDVIDHTAPPGMPPGREGVKQFTTMFHAAFPDLRFTIKDQVAEGDKVTTRCVMTGTHKGPLMGIPPTGKAVSITTIDITRWSNGKAVEHWGVEDMLGLMQQLGVVPMPGQAQK